MMKAKLTGPIECNVCKWKGQPDELKIEKSGEVVMCPSCKMLLMDFSDGNFLIQHITAQKLEFIE